MSNCIIVLFKIHNTTCPASQSVLYSERQLFCLLGICCEGRRELEDSDDSTGISTNSPQIIEKQQISFDRTSLGLDIDGIDERYCHLSSNLVDFCKTDKKIHFLRIWQIFVLDVHVPHFLRIKSSPPRTTWAACMLGPTCSN